MDQSDGFAASLWIVRQVARSAGLFDRLTESLLISIKRLVCDSIMRWIFLLKFFRQLSILGILTVFLVCCAGPKGVYHRVGSGQTIYQISRTYGVEVERISHINRIHDPSRLKVGQQLFIPGVDAVKRVPATVKTASRKASRPTSVRSRPASPSVKSKPTVKPKPAPSSKSKPKATKPRGKAKPSKGRFLWPAKGPAVRHFGGKGSKKSSGVEIALGKGGRINSAAAGKVIYAGSGISGYGNLIILQHDASYYTVYGYNSKNLVSADHYVSRGQKIALSGVPPSGGRPRLYFEVRYGKKPVNPILYLP